MSDPRVTDEMVEAHARAIHAITWSSDTAGAETAWLSTRDILRRYARVGLEAALAAAPAVEPVAVKPLKWKQLVEDSWIAKTDIGTYRIYWYGGEDWACFNESISGSSQKAGSLETAKAAAQADYEQRRTSDPAGDGKTTCSYCGERRHTRCSYSDCPFDADRLPDIAESLKRQRDKAIAERDELDALLHEGGSWEKQLATAERQRDEALALVERMREALRSGADYIEMYHFASERERAKGLAGEMRAALSLTPSAALAEHDARVRRECAAAAREVERQQDSDLGFANTGGAEAAALAIEALNTAADKGGEHG